MSTRTVGQDVEHSDDADLCSREGCENSAEKAVEWSTVDEPITYCEGCADAAVRAFPELASMVEGGGTTEP